jgi:hypothetical protein
MTDLDRRYAEALIQHVETGHLDAGYLDRVERFLAAIRGEAAEPVAATADEAAKAPAPPSLAVVAEAQPTPPALPAPRLVAMPEPEAEAEAEPAETVSPDDLAGLAEALGEPDEPVTILSPDAERTARKLYQAWQITEWMQPFAAFLEWYKAKRPSAEYPAPTIEDWTGECRATITEAIRECLEKQPGQHLTEQEVFEHVTRRRGMEPGHSTVGSILVQLRQRLPQVHKVQTGVWVWQESASEAAA